MKVDFTVHAVRKGHVSVDATIGDVKQRVLVDGIEVELVTAEGRSVTLPFHGSALKEAEEAFKLDNVVSFEVTGA